MSQSERRRRRRRERREQRTGIPRQFLWIGAAGLILIIAISAVTFLTGDDAEASFEPVASLDYEYSPNHLHGIGHDHESDRLFLASHFGLFALEDGQLYQVGDSRDDLMGFSMNPNDPNEIYVSGHPQGGGNLGVKRSSDAGLNFEQIFTGVDDEIVDFHSMTLSAADPDRFYGSFMGQIYRSEDGGENWVAFQPDGLPERGLCWGVPCLEAGSGDANIVFAGTEQGLMISTDAGETWEVLNAEIGQTAAVKVDPQDRDRIVAYTQVMGLSVSTDGGESWTSRHGDLAVGDGGYVFAIALDQNDSERMFVATMNNQVFETVDGGDTWTVVVE
jgi:photosystem II stability/assembly factor-like uncharacterized protein